MLNPTVLSLNCICHLLLLLLLRLLPLNLRSMPTTACPIPPLQPPYRYCSRFCTDVAAVTICSPWPQGRGSSNTCAGMDSHSSIAFFVASVELFPSLDLLAFRIADRGSGPRSDGRFSRAVSIIAASRASFWAAGSDTSNVARRVPLSTKNDAQRTREACITASRRLKPPPIPPPLCDSSREESMSSAESSGVGPLVPPCHGACFCFRASCTVRSKCCQKTCMR